MFSKFDTNPQSDELTAADLYDAQAEWEAELYDGEPIMDLADDLYMIFDDPDYWGYPPLVGGRACAGPRTPRW